MATNQNSQSGHLQRVVRAFAWCVVVVCSGLVVILAATIFILAGWAFVDDWPNSAIGCGIAMVFAIVLAALAMLWVWAWGVVAGKGSNAQAERP